jgi:hypothetical protein
MTYSRQSRLTLAATIGIALTALPGCWVPGYSPGGPQASRDLYTYDSTPDHPQNITVLDWTTGEKLLTVEVPVGQQLVMRFYEDYDIKNAARPALMRWKLMRAGTSWGELTNSMPVPDMHHRRVDPELRSASESVPKPANVPPPEPVAPPAK